MKTITPTDHEKSEWSRLARDAYAKDLNDIGHRFSMAASATKRTEFDLSFYDQLQSEYRAWLVGGFEKDNEEMYAEQLKNLNALCAERDRLRLAVHEALAMAENLRKATGDAIPAAICHTLRSALT